MVFKIVFITGLGLGMVKVKLSLLGSRVIARAILILSITGTFLGIRSWLCLLTEEEQC